MRDGWCSFRHARWRSRGDRRRGEEHALQGVVACRVVGHAVLPAAPDDVGPGPGEDAHGMGMALATLTGPAVEVGGPGVRPAAVLREVDERLAQLLVAGEAERHRPVLAGLAGRGRGPGQTGERLGRGEPLAAVADLGEERRGADPAGTGQAREEGAVRVPRQLLDDARFEHLGLLVDGPHGSHEGEGHRGHGLGGLPVDPGWCGHETGVELGAAASARVALRREPGRHPPGAEPGRPLSGGEAHEEGPGDGRGQLVEEVDRSGEGERQVGRQLLCERGPMADEVLAGPHARPQGQRLGGIGLERPEAVAVGAQGIGEDVRVGAVVLVARQAVAGAQRLDVAAGDDDHGQVSLEQRLDHGAIRSLDGHALDPCEPGHQLPQPSVAVLDLEAGHRAAALVHDADRVGVLRPVDAGVPADTIHVCLLAGTSSLGAPFV